MQKFNLFFEYFHVPKNIMDRNTKKTPIHCFGDIFSFKNAQAKMIVTSPNIEAVTDANVENVCVPA